MATVTSEGPQVDHAIVMRNVCFTYMRQDGSALPVLKNMSLSLPYGEIIGLVGRNGVGKSTLFDILRGVLVPQLGAVHVGEMLVTSVGKLFRRPFVPIVSQRPDAALAPTMTVYENFAITASLHVNGLRWAYSRDWSDACYGLLARADMGLEHKCDEQVRFLSAGQQQALSVLLALQTPNHLLLMDEPTAALDPIAADKVMHLAISEVQRVGGTILLVSHRLRDIAEKCSRVIVLKDGGVARDIDCASSRVTEEELLESMSAS